MNSSEKPKIVHLTYEHEDGSWSAESEQLPSLFAGGDSLDDAKELAHQVIHEELGDDVTIIDWMPVPADLEPRISSRGARVGSAVSTEVSGPAEAAKPLGEWLLPPQKAEPTA